MTRQEASKIIEQYRMCSNGDCPTLECADCEYNHDPRKVEEAFLMAVDALDEDKNAPSKDGDTISRQAAIDEIRECFSMGGCHADQYSIVGHINSLPSVQPKHKPGKWEIYVISPFDGEGCRCSECKYEGAPYWDFCPNCGAEMTEVSLDEE